MHHSTKTSKPANLLLAIGLTIVTQFIAVGPGNPAESGAWRHTEPLPSAIDCLAPAPVDLGVISSAGAVAGIAQPASCDRCRAVCARNCSSYACIACAKSIKCGTLVQACVATKRKA
jgi:hypothetical protein